MTRQSHLALSGLRVVPDMESTLSDEISLAHSWPTCIWECFTSLLDDSASSQSLRNLSLDALHTAAAYINEKIFKVMRSFPWKLALDHSGAAMAELAHADEDPEDSFTLKLRTLLLAGVPPQPPAASL